MMYIMSNRDAHNTFRPMIESDAFVAQVRCVTNWSFDTAKKLDRRLLRLASKRSMPTASSAAVYLERYRKEWMQRYCAGWSVSGPRFMKRSRLLSADELRAVMR